MFNVLLTSVGRRVELVRGFRAAYRGLGLAGRIVATDIDELAPAFQVVDTPIRVPRIKDPRYLPKIIEICETQDISLVLPLIDPEIPVLSRHKVAIEQTGAKLGVVDLAATEISQDKWLAFEFFRRIGLPTPKSWLPDNLPSEIEFPIFAKPRTGSAAENTFPIRNQRELEFFRDYVPNPIFQEFLPGPEITSDIVCGLDGRVLSVISRERIAVRGGEAIKAVTIHDERIRDACHEIAKELPAVGPITAQCMMKDGVPHFIEINARLGGGIPLAIAAGVDVPALLLADAANLTTEIATEYQAGLYMTRCDESFFVTEKLGEQLTSRHL